MLKIKTYGHDFHYDIMELLKVFDIPCKIICCNEYLKRPLLVIEDEAENVDTIDSMLLFKDNKILVITISKFKGNIQKSQELLETTENVHINNKRAKNLVKRGIYKLLEKESKKTIPWGILTGIRPTKLVHELLNNNLEDHEIINTLCNRYFISEDKAKLLLEIAKSEYNIIYPIDDNKISLYISIPFCPSRCTYCSFPSNTIKGWGHLTDKYVDALCEEIKLTSQINQIKNKAIDTVYIGGGTPSSLSSTQIERILLCLCKRFDLSEMREFTFEAGRPETITIEKLKVLKSNGVTRLSINPQTMNDTTLKEINREHSSKDIVDAYNMATEMGFHHINMDIIIGLPKENLDMVKYTMERIKLIQPLSITVHTLAIKKASNLKESQYEKSVNDHHILDMIEITKDYAKSMGLYPYYLYRQKHMVGNLENIGYSKLGYEGIYNIQIIEEKQTIIAMGAGAVSKVVFNDENRLERVPNVKDLEHYINRVEEMVERKRKALEGIL